MHELLTYCYVPSTLCLSEVVCVVYPSSMALLS